MDDNNKFKIRLKNLRKENNMTQEDLANKIGLGRTAITNYETGRNSPDAEMLSIISKVLYTTTDYLLGNSDIRDPYNEDKEQLPDDFDTAEEAIDFLLNKNVIMGAGGFDIEDLSDEDKVRFANELLEHLKLLSLKYKK